MRAAVIPFGILVPVSVLSFGLVNRFIEGKIGLGLSLVFLFFNGGGVSRQNCFLYIRFRIFLIFEELIYSSSR